MPHEATKCPVVGVAICVRLDQECLPWPNDNNEDTLPTTMNADGAIAVVGLGSYGALTGAATIGP